MKLTHAGAAHLVLRNVLNTRRHAYTGWCELGVPVGILDVVTVSYPWTHEYYEGQRADARTTYDKLKHNHDLDVAAVQERMRRGERPDWPTAPSTTQRGPGGLPYDIGKAKKPAPPRIDVFEVKVSLADLRQDLKRSKMLAYQTVGTHCTLVIGPEVWPGETNMRIESELTRYGLPGEWGIDQLTRHRDLINIRRTKPVRKAKPGELLELVLAMSRSAAYRLARHARADDAEGEPDAV